MRRGLRIIGSIIYDHPGDFVETRRALASAAVPVQRTVGAGIPADLAATAFEQARRLPTKSWIDLTDWWDQGPLRTT
ncbi:MAG: hypothetical protein ACRDWI_13415 [Jiangellaceae bacterium]